MLNICKNIDEININDILSRKIKSIVSYHVSDDILSLYNSKKKCIIKGTYQYVGSFDKKKELWLWGYNYGRARDELKNTLNTIKKDIISEYNKSSSNFCHLEELLYYVQHEVIFISNINYDKFIKFLVYTFKTFDFCLVNKENDKNIILVFIIKNIVDKNI